MGRTPKGKPLTLRPVRLDNDVWAECQRLGKLHGTINEGLRVALGFYVTIPASRVVVNDTPHPVTVIPLERAEIVQTVRPRPFKGPLLKPSEKKR